MIKASKAVATITGTVGFEALLSSKPVLLFGYAWYKDCPYAYFIDSVKYCREVLNNIKNDILFDENKIINFLKSFEQASVHGYIGIKTKLGVTSSLKEDQSMDNLLNTLTENN